MKAVLLIMAGATGLYGQTVTVEADPDIYFDRGITFAAGVKPNAESRWTFFGDFASRKVGPLRKHERLQWRFGGMARFRFLGNRNGPFGQLGLSYGQFRAQDRTVARGVSLRPGLGIQWFPWKTKGFYFAPQAGIENYPGTKRVDKRGELRVGWQF